MAWYNKQKQVEEQTEEIDETNMERKVEKLEETGMQENENTMVESCETIISGNTSFAGDIQSEEDICVKGEVRGNIQCGNIYILQGKVEGNIRCRNAVLDSGGVKGDIECSENLSLIHESRVEGNVNTMEFVNGGWIQGNANVYNHVELKEGSAIFGDVSAKTIAIEKGAIMQGCFLIGQDKGEQK